MPTDNTSASSRQHAPAADEGTAAANIEPFRAGHFAGSQSRDASLSRGRNNVHGTATGVHSSRTPSAHPTSTIPEGESTHVGGTGVDASLQRRLSNRHHRQTSVINGLQHSRNPSFNSPLATSPLSPESLHNANLRNPTHAGSRRPTGYSTDNDSLNSSSLPLSSHLQNLSIDSTLNLNPTQPISLGNLQSTASSVDSQLRRPSNNVAPNPSQIEGKTSDAYAVQHLLASFFTKADRKINDCLAQSSVLASPVEQTIGPGADPTFDQHLRALGHVSRSKPKALADALIHWRQLKVDAAAAAKLQLDAAVDAAQQAASPTVAIDPSMGLTSRRIDGTHEPGVAHSGAPSQVMSQIDPNIIESVTYTSHQSTVAVYVLCRGLIEVFAQGEVEQKQYLDLAQRLADIVFEQLREANIEAYVTDKFRAAMWRIYSQLLGSICRVEFDHVANLFCNQLRIWTDEIGRSGAPTVKIRDLESRVELLLFNMQSLRLNTEPSVSNSTCDFLKDLALLFADAHGPRIKQAYCATFETLLLQIASRPDLTVKNTRFDAFIESINPKINQMLTKMRHWAHALPISIILLCLSAIEVFHAQWWGQMNGLANKLRERTTRVQAMRAICQLTWAYIHRSTDNMTAKTKKIEEIIRLVLPPGRRPHITTEPAMAEALLFFTRMVAVFNHEMCFKLIVLPLVNPDGIFSARDIRPEQFEPEKVTIGIRSVLLIIEDQENKIESWPTFPKFVAPLPVFDNQPLSPMPYTANRAADAQAADKLIAFTISSEPINTSICDDVTKTFLRQFCEILSKIIVHCDNAFGGFTAVHDRFSVTTPKTPLGDAFLSRRDDGTTSDPRALSFGLLNAAIRALPRCLSETMPINILINVLCTASAHMQPHIAASAKTALKAIANQGHAQIVATAYPRFMFNHDPAYSSMSDDGRLGPEHNEPTLALYLDLLQIWIAQTKIKFGSSQNASASAEADARRALQIEMQLPFVENIEGYGLFFLCSQSRQVRAYAIKVLQTVLDFDNTLNKTGATRVFAVLESHADQILDITDADLTTFERSRLQKDRRRKQGASLLIELGTGISEGGAELWSKLFPKMLRVIFEQCPHASALSREFVCDRLALMLPGIERLSSSTASFSDAKIFGRPSDAPVSVFLEQWKLYLIMACVTLNSTGGQSRGQLDNAVHTRKTSRNTSGLQDKMSSARSLFSAVIPLLGAATEQLRAAVVTALGSINRKLYRILLESLQYAVITCNDEAKARRGAHQRTPSSPSRSQMTERMRVEVTCIYKLTAHFLKHEDILKDDWIVANLMNYAKELRLFLNDNEIHSDWKFSRLRLHYCGLVDVIYNEIKETAESSRHMSFEARKSAFMLMEEWCGFRTEGAAQHFALDPDSNDKSSVAKERVNLRTAALSAMATLCAGPLSIVTDSNIELRFNVSRMLRWVHSVFASKEHKLCEIGQRALKNLILYNPGEVIFVEQAIQCCYGVAGEVAQESCFNVLADVLTQEPHFPIDKIKVFGAVIFTLGHDNRAVRMRSASLLRALDDKEQKSSNLQHFEIGVADKTRAVFKAAQFEFSKRLAQKYPDFGFHIFSEFCLQFRSVSRDIQRSMVAAILPWLQTLELQVLPNSSQPAELSYMLLVNMIEITINAGNALYNEVQALWQALATGPHGGNVHLILEFIVNLSMERREQSFIYFAKQIVVYLAATQAGAMTFQHFLLQLAPKNMPKDTRTWYLNVPENTQLPYMANLNELLPIGTRSSGLSLGQTSLILLVDLLVPPAQLKQEDALKLLHAVFILWDDQNSIVQEHAREMLVHLIHTLVVVRLEKSQTNPHLTEKAEALVEMIRSEDSSFGWAYGEFATKNEANTSGLRLPQGMIKLAQISVDVFATALDDFNNSWAREALTWASICPVRHLACRSFQVFRCVFVKLDSSLLSDMLARLSNTIAVEHSDYQTFSLEILTTLKLVMTDLSHRQILKFPQLVWTTVACLDTIHEREFEETLGMLQQLTCALDFGDPTAVDHVLKAQPAAWNGAFEGIQPLIYKGLQSSRCLNQTLDLLETLHPLPDSELLGTGSRFVFTVVALLPRAIQSIQTTSPATREGSETLEKLASSAQAKSLNELSEAIKTFGSSTREALDVQISKLMSVLIKSFPEENEADVLIFLIGLLQNSQQNYKGHALMILSRLLSIISLEQTNLLQHGGDLLAPLLRLLGTDLYEQTLLVIDPIMEHLRLADPQSESSSMMSSVESSASMSRAYRNPLYGSPDVSGWSVPLPAQSSHKTRENVHHVFFACTADEQENSATPADTPQVEFQAEEDDSDSYFPRLSHPLQHHVSFDNATDVTMGDIVNSLDSLDDFFEENESVDTPTAEDRTSNGFSAFSFFSSGYGLPDNAEDRGLLRMPVQNERSSSSMSAHRNHVQHEMNHDRPHTSQWHRPQHSYSSAANGYQASFGSIDEDDGPGPSMPTIERSFESITHPQQSSRSTLHSRSITSPANQYPISRTGPRSDLPKVTTNSSDPYLLEDMLSDTEHSPFPSIVSQTTHGATKSVSSTPTSATDASASFMRRGMRRLTGGKIESAREKARLRAPSIGQNAHSTSLGSSQSPRMPRIPSEYLNQPPSSAPSASSPSAYGPRPNE